MANDFQAVLKRVANVFVTEEKIGKSDTTWSWAMDVETAYKKYKESPDGNTLTKLSNQILDAYGKVTYRLKDRYPMMTDDMSTLNFKVLEYVRGNSGNTFRNMVDKYIDEGVPFLLFFHYKVIKQKYNSLRKEEVAKEQCGSLTFVKSDLEKLDKINKQAKSFFGIRALECSDDELVTVCELLNDSGKIKNLTVDEAKRIIKQNTVSRKINREDSTKDEVDSAVAADEIPEESVDETTVYGKLFNDSEKKTVFENILSSAGISRRRYFNIGLMYRYLYVECKDDRRFILHTFYEFIKMAVWLKEDEKSELYTIFKYIERNSKEKLPTLDEIAVKAMGLNSGSQPSREFKNVVKMIAEETGIVL